MKNKVVIFDLDGVIVKTSKYHYLAWKKIANHLNISFTEKENEFLKGVSRVESLEFILKLGNKKIDEKEKLILLEQKNNYYLEYISKMGKNELLPGIQKLLSDLHQSKIPFALGSSSKNARYLLQILNIKDLFSAIIDGNDVHKAKPDPEVFLKAAKKMNVKPENCIVIEDSLAGIQAANKAGMYSIGIGKKEILKEAKLVLNNTQNLDIQIINKIKI